MKNEFTIVQLNEKLPLSFSVCRFTQIFPDAYPDIRLIVVLDGTCDITVNGETYSAKKNDRIIINPFAVNSFASKRPCTRLIAKINQYGFELDEEEALGLKFYLNTRAFPNNKRYDSIRYLLFSIIKFNTRDNINSLYTNRAIIFSLFAQLRNDFRVESQNEEISRNSRKLNAKIISYLHLHYKENVSLQFLSEHFNYNLSYLSRLFRKCQGKTFNEYYDSLKINNSRNALLYTDKTIEEIATDNGFENARSYVRAFRKEYKDYPSEYRVSFRNKESKAVPQDIALIRKETLNQILKYSDDYNKAHGTGSESTRDLAYVLEADYHKKEKEKKNPLTLFLPIGNIYNVLREDRRDAIANRCNQVPFSYGILTDLFASPYRNGPYGFKLDNQALFTIQQAISFLLKLKRKPVLRFSIGPQEDQKSFLTEVSSLRKILSIFFGEKEVSSWILSLESKTSILSLLPSEFYQFKKTLLQFNQISKSFNCRRIAPSIPRKTYTDNEIKEIHKLIPFEEKKFDFYSFDYASFQGGEEIVKSKDSLSEFIQYLSSINLYYQNTIIENVRFSKGNNLLYDTLYASSYIGRSLLKNYDSLFAITFFSLSDSALPLISLRNPFQGVYGYYSFNGRKKASVNALYLLSKAGNHVTESGKNYLISKDENHLTILLNNYCHYSLLFAEGDYYQISDKERYSCFPKSTNYNYEIHIKNLPKEKVRIKITSLSPKSGSSYDLFIASGGDESRTKEEYRSLSQSSQCSFLIEEKEAKGGNIDVEVQLPPLERKLIEIQF